LGRAGREGECAVKTRLTGRGGGALRAEGGGGCTEGFPHP
jgi:hypothetical protein